MKAKIYNVLLLVCCVLYAVVRGRATHVVLKPGHFVVVQNAKLGDMVCTTPVFRAIKQQYPRALVTVVGDQVNKHVLAGHTDVDDYIVWNRDPRGVSDMLYEVRRRAPDVAMLATPDFYTLAVLFLSGVPAIVAPVVRNGSSPYETRSFTLLRRLVLTRPHHMRHYAPREYLRLLEPLGIEVDDTTKRLAVRKDAVARVDILLRKAGVEATDVIVGLSPSAGNKIKCWGSENWAALINQIHAAHVPPKRPRIVIIGGKHDTAEVEATCAGLAPSVEVINTLNQLSLEELKALIARMHVFIAVDTGPVYIAESFNVPTIDIVGPIDEREQPPIGEWHKVVVAPREEPALFVLNARVYNKEEAERQTKAITPAYVFDVYTELYENVYQRFHRGKTTYS